VLVRRDFSADKPVQMGDTIVVPSVQYSVRVDGAVTRSGLYPFNPRFGIQEYIATAGGRTRTAKDLGDVRVIDLNGMTRRYSNTLKPLPGDAIVVPERGYSRAEVVQLVFAGAGLILSGVAITLAATR
jgi:protein involved in polysaccharide export with SLBB domain